jgi:hypothetical protein
MSALVSIEGWNPALGGPDSVRFATGRGYVSTPDSSPPHAVFAPRLIQAGNFRRRIALAAGPAGGATEPGYGEIIVNNADGALDHLLDWGFDGRRLEIRRGPVETAVRPGRWPEDFPAVLVGTVEGTEWERRRIIFRLRDRLAEVADRLLIEDVYAGDNVAPDGLEGTEADLKGEAKPQPVGIVRNVRLSLVNASKLIFQAAHRAVQAIDVQAMNDQGAALTAGSDFASLADLQDDGEAPSSGQYRVYPGTSGTGAYVRLGSSPAGEVTARIAEGDSDADRLAGAVMTRLLVLSGVSPAEIDGAAALDGAFPATVGFWAPPGGARAGEALDLVAASVHGWWTQDRGGRFVLSRLTEPDGPSRLEIGPQDILDDGTALRRVVGATEGIPAWRVTVRYQRNWTVQRADSLAGVALSDKAWLGQEYRSVVAEDPAIRAKHLLAREIEVETALDREADAQALAAHLLSLYRVRRDVYEISVPGTLAERLDLGQVLTLRLPRFDLAGGKRFVLLGEDFDLTRNRAVLTIWG